MPSRPMLIKSVPFSYLGPSDSPPPFSGETCADQGAATQRDIQQEQEQGGQAGVVA